MRYSSRFFLYAPFVLLLVLAALSAGYWWQSASALDARLKAAKGHDIVPGVTLDWSAMTISGFPFRLDVAFDGLAVKGEGAHGPFAWTTEKFAVHALTYGAQNDVFEAAGTQHLAWSDADGRAQTLDFLPGTLRASAERDARGLIRFDVDIVQLSARDLSIGRAQFHMRRDPDGKSIDLMAEATLVKGNLGALGPELRELQLYQTVSQASAFSGLLRGEQSPAAAHAAWRAAQGVSTTTIKKLEGGAKEKIPDPAVVGALDGLLAPLY